MNYTTLIADKDTAGSIKSWVNHSLLDVVQVVEEAEALLAQTLRVPEMTALATLSMVVGDSTEALPAGFLDPIYLYDITNEWEIKNRDPAALMRRRKYDSGVLLDGSPRNYSVFANELQFESKYDANATLHLLHFKKWTALSSAITNFLTDRYPHLLRTACLAKAWEFRGFEIQESKELTKLAALIEKTNAEADLVLRGMVPDNEVA